MGSSPVQILGGENAEAPSKTRLGLSGCTIPHHFLETMSGSVCKLGGILATTRGTEEDNVYIGTSDLVNNVFIGNMSTSASPGRDASGPLTRNQRPVDSL